MVTVTYFYRQPRKTGLSIEGIFTQVRKQLAGKIDIKEFYCDARQSRARQIVAAGKAAGEINHITGDVNFLVMGMKNKKNILTIHDFGHYEYLGKTNYLQHLIYRWFWYRLPLKHVAITTVISEFTKDKLVKYFNFPEHKIRVIGNPVKSVFRQAAKGHINTVPRIMMIGSGKHKNLDGLIEAARGTNFHLDIVGWPEQDELTRLRDYGIAHTVYNGLTDEQVYERYKECDLLYFASFHEGFGMPIIEAQAVGRPVITSNLGAMKEIAGASAVLVDPKDTAEIRKAIHLLVSDKEIYDKYVRLGIQNASAYGIEYIARQYQLIYEELANSK